VGEGPGRGFNINIPWNKGKMGDAEYEVGGGLRQVHHTLMRAQLEEAVAGMCYKCAKMVNMGLWRVR
jgi:hypothetical protein